MVNTKYKVQLIFPEGGSRLSSTGILPPLGIIALGTYLKEKDQNANVDIIDGSIFSKEEIIENLNGKYLGLSVTGVNYLNSLEIAKKAKEKGMIIIVGGPHSTINHKKILEDHPFIDYAIRGDGEKAFYNLFSFLININIYLHDLQQK